jgi:Glycosyltransferase
MKRQFLKIIHCFRSPQGGLFRHVLDLSKWQSQNGHQVGLITGNVNDSPIAKNKLSEISEFLRLGVYSFPISRFFDHRDLFNLLRIRSLLKKIRPDIVHGHGAKGGVYGRLGGLGLTKTFYTPHGGSLHYSRKTFKGILFFSTELLMRKISDGIIFESEYAKFSYVKKVGALNLSSTVIHNGLNDEEFEGIDNSQAEYDLGFVGELRLLKGVDLLLGALSHWPKSEKIPRCLIVGEGKDSDFLKGLAKKLSLKDVDFIGSVPAQNAFKKIKLLVIPSKAESLPYIVLEALAAKVPVIVTNVGGIPEIFGESKTILISPDEKQLLEKIIYALKDIDGYKAELALVYQRASDFFKLKRMAKEITSFYEFCD